MDVPGPGTLTRLLNGEHAPNTARLHEDLYRELRILAATRLRREPGGPAALQTTALVHEAWVKLAGGRWESREHFFGAAARAMRQVLVDQARSRRAPVGNIRRTPTTVIDPATEIDPLDVLALDEALTELAEHDPRAAAIVELRFFAGLDMPEAAAAARVPLRTAQRDWQHARAWLLARLRTDEP